MDEIVAIVGLGYVGLPLAIAFGSRRPTVGFDLDSAKIANYRNGVDPSGEVSSMQFEAASDLKYTSEPALLRDAHFIIVAVPTPVDANNKPDLEMLSRACKLVGENLSRGATVIFESTVFPGCTEDFCVPLLEDASSFTWSGSHTEVRSDAQEFSVAYSPERINPADPEHRLESIVKVVAGDTEDTLQRVAELYTLVVEAGIYKAPSIRVAEAAKVIENTQRDLNIALMNELAMIFDRMDIDTLEVLEAAGTKWNFLPFRPGLVGGHCIGVDPYYLTYKAKSVGYEPQVILAGRQINDGMGKFIADKTVEQLSRLGVDTLNARVTVLGITFKEDCPDLRNSQVAVMVRRLLDAGCDVNVHDPLALSADAEKEYGIRIIDWNELSPADAVVLAVPHRQYVDMDISSLCLLLAEGGIFIDVKSRLDNHFLSENSIPYWRL